MPRQGEGVTSHPSHPLDPPLVLDRKTAELAAEAPRSNRSISPARGAHSSKPATRCRWDRHTDRQTDRHLVVTIIDPTAYYASSVNNHTCSSSVYSDIVVNKAV